MNKEQTAKAITAIKETYPDINWERFEIMDRVLNGYLWHGPSFGLFLEDNPDWTTGYTYPGLKQCMKDIEEILEPLPHEMWFDLDGQCIVTNSDPNDFDDYWRYFCKYCDMLLWKDDNGAWVDDSDGDCCSGDDDLNNENQPHEPDIHCPPIWVGGEWEKINVRKTLMCVETYKQVF